MKSRFKIHIKVVSIIVIISFLSNDVVWAQTSHQPSVINYHVLGNISIPSGIGKITQTFQGRNGKTIFHIVDTHGDYFVQKNYAEILKQIVGQKTLLAIEGANGLIDTSEEEKLQLVLSFHAKHGFGKSRLFYHFIKKPSTIFRIFNIYSNFITRFFPILMRSSLGYWEESIFFQYMRKIALGYNKFRHGLRKVLIEAVQRTLTNVVLSYVLRRQLAIKNIPCNNQYAYTRGQVWEKVMESLQVLMTQDIRQYFLLKKFLPLLKSFLYRIGSIPGIQQYSDFPLVWRNIVELMDISSSIPLFSLFPDINISGLYINVKYKEFFTFALKAPGSDILNENKGGILQKMKRRRRGE